MRNQRTRAGYLIAVTCIALVAAACTTADVDREPSSAGLNACADAPDTCNSGPRADGGTITWLIDQGHDGVYNHLRPEGGTVYLAQMMEGLHPSIGYFAPSGEWVWDFDLLESEPEIVSQEPQTMVYELRDEAVWSDGTPIDVDDFLWSWYHNSGNEELCVGCEPRATTGWADVASIEGSDDGKTITVTLKDGVVNPEWFAHFGVSMYPAHWSGEDWRTPEGMGRSSEFFLTNVPDWSGGPYIVDSWVPNERVVMTPNAEWYGASEPTLDTLVKEVISDQGAWVPALENGEIHGSSPGSFSLDLLDQLERLDDVYVGLGSAGATWEHVNVNMFSLTDPALRRAIFTAIDVRDARSRIFGELEPPLRTNHIFSSSNPYHEDKMAATGYGSGDLEAARDILDEAGYSGFEDGGVLLDPDGEPVQDIRFAFLAGNEPRATFAELAQSYLAEIGLSVVPQAIPGDQLGSVLFGQQFDLAIFAWGGSPLFSGTPAQFYHSESGSNFGGLDNPEIDRLAEAATNQADRDDSAELANEVVELVMEEAFSLPLWDLLDLAFVTDDYANIRDNHHAGVRALYNSAEWGVLAR